MSHAGHSREIPRKPRWVKGGNFNLLWTKNGFVVRRPNQTGNVPATITPTNVVGYR